MVIYDPICKKYVNIFELTNNRHDKKNELIIKLLKENNEKLDEITLLLKEVLEGGKGNSRGTESEASDSTGGVTETKAVSKSGWKSGRGCNKVQVGGKKSWKENRTVGKCVK